MNGGRVDVDSLTADIKSLAGASTADLIGIAPGSAFTVEEFGDLGTAFGPIQSIVVFAFHIVDPVQTVRFYSGRAHTESLIATSFGDAMLRDACWRVVEMLREAGWRAAVPRNLRYGVADPPHSISYKKAAVLAGLGSFGKNQLLIHPEWGPWLFLRTVVTDAPLPPDAPIRSSPCDNCRDCLGVCPSGALSASGFDRPRCEQVVGYQGGRPPAVVHLSSHGRINCEECMRACPVGTAPPRLVPGFEQP